MFDQFGNPIASPTFPAMQGYGAGGNFATSYFDSLSAPQSSLGSLLTPSVAAPVLMGQQSVPTLPDLTSINAAKPAGSMWDSFFNKTENGITQQGWGGLALGTGSALMNGILGFQQLGIAKDTLAQNKRAFDLNFAAQRKTTNARLNDRQEARVAYGAGATPVSEYMAKYGI